MKRYATLFLTLTFLAAFGAAVAFAETQTACPVMGGEVTKELYADYQGKRVYFCCAYCIGEFNKDPEKYLQKMKEMGQEPEIIKEK